jgi:prophage maintenance system killer protein
VGANAAITFLLMNNWEPDFDEEELIDLVLSVASGRLAKPALAAIFEARCRSLEAG